ncbi:UPF0061-domain-containing protein [Athelia psychrophila]|uniref:Selenoprotein O n=1 Tax=Athelia psychrophila TaxID=1759441 RepID=A0A166UBR9_9AGAM|nr:UPF0061-domain-containing protein [Fibularhizoctonia sp. CBS 109695]
MLRRAMSTKYKISSLPLAPSTQLLTSNLTADPQTPNPSTFRTQILSTKPSIQRRARLLAKQSHFSYVSPLPLPFPFEIEPPEGPELNTPEERSAWVETWLAAREATHAEEGERKGGLVLYRPEKDRRDQNRHLIGLAQAGIRDCLPHLDVGDAFDELGEPTLVPKDSAPPNSGPNEAREELVDVLSGYAVLMSEEFAPWALRYSGHQFGSWAGQLGDGRALSILVTPHPTDPAQTYELQLKGAGRTPFSRSADGLAVLRSSVREYLCSEAMHALGIPTTRSLALLSLPDLPVARERMEGACILTRVAPSFLRIGSFEALNPPQNAFFFGGGQQERDLEALRVLGEWVAKQVLGLDRLEEGWGQRLVLEVARRNALMVGQWQAYGFMHGVMNTDNISILGLTIDYGPYAFMDVYDPFHICNHSDDLGRYAFKYQPENITYACNALLTSLAPLIGAELAAGHAVGAGWADDADDAKIAEWTKGGLAVKEELEQSVKVGWDAEWMRAMRTRLGLKTDERSDDSQVVAPLLRLMKDHKLDYHGVFRQLCFFQPSLRGEALDKFVERVLALTPETLTMDRASAAADLRTWLSGYATRILSENPTVDEAGLEAQRKAANPRFVLRQWVLEEVISALENDEGKGKRVLGKVMQMVERPFEAWGAEGTEGTRDDCAIGEEEAEERRFCGMGAKSMLGFQCSCSS